MADGKTVAKRFIFTTFKKSDMSANTLNELFRAFSWSMNVLLRGVTPSFDWLNRPMIGGVNILAGGYRGAFCQVRGDWAFYCELFYFPQWNCADRMCWMCRASSNDPDLAWTEFSATAGWRDTMWSHESYMTFLRTSGLTIPVLFTHLIGFRLDCVMIDVLHTVDQGVASHVIGNVL